MTEPETEAWEQQDTGDEIFRITSLENRFDPSRIIIWREWLIETRL